MKKSWILGIAALGLIAASCGNKNAKTEEMNEENTTKQASTEVSDDFEWQTEQFADIRILRYQVPAFASLNLKQKELVYYLTQASLAGRDIIWDQNYKHNLVIRKALESVITNYDGDKNAEEWNQFMVYAKRVFFSNGIHHHYGMSKFVPECSKDFFNTLLTSTKTSIDASIVDGLFDETLDAKRVNLDASKDLIAGSVNNFYQDGITTDEVDAYYAGVIDTNDAQPISYGLNSTMVRDVNGNLTEEVWNQDSRYGGPIKEIIKWLEKAEGVAESEEMARGFALLVEYYKTGDLKIWDEYNIQWAKTTGDVIDYINGFIEVYGDAKGFRGTYESIIQINDFDASARMTVVAENAQFFEDNSTIMDEHKKKKVTGVSYKVVNAAFESGDAAPSTPIGVNLPNANWIRSTHGSKSVSLGNIVEAYNSSSGGSYLEEFAYSQEEIDRAKKHAKLASKLHTALHEVIGHASGQINEGIGTPKETLQNYASTLEEARADLVALYYLLDNKLLEMGLMESLEVGMAEYDSYIRNGMMVQMRRLKKGDNIEEAHMRNRQLVASWAFEKGAAENVIMKKVKEGKTFFVVNDYEKLRVLFGDLLKEIQRIKSEGDFQAGMNLVESYGVNVDKEIHAEVLERSAKLNIAPYSGFINPSYNVSYDDNGDVIDYVISYPTDFVSQMLNYGVSNSFMK